MKFRKIIFFILVLPLTLILDLILYATTKSCPSCGSFTQWIQMEGALSFPLVVELTEYFTKLLKLPRLPKSPVK